ncbi:hypothetical protein [Pseudomonas cichorii]|uniref:Uncharacterized protein n=1 Tax=Pseudomonas cichorii TaxID=36746 RepID=A0ABQ1DS53_PSECI|nr:hypothetical protein [Pseudomonas cichorii]MBX8532482.1 hypothetical protein [Pseudomonas cichorii]QVE17028.1 hypothetical protein KGD89_24930 [Pseudomonas cichorii]SDO80040.1 hypothetical protein SAMN05216599_11398 [Pseudomonas cichorii]GFM78516.1 hypothetical protein PSCICM_43350 [Pseudomonas cichorii]GFM93847.1 hypothetical protein PSCICP_38190 [Pseudomonas cichorii]
MTAKIRVNLKDGLLEAEGSEAFIEKLYSDFKELISFHQQPIAANRMELLTSETSTTAVSAVAADVAALKAPTKTETQKPKAKAKKSNSTEPTLLKDLNLAGNESYQGLREFYSKYSTKTNMERNLVFTYYLTKIMSIGGVSASHIFSCYRHIAGIKIPGNLKQSLYDTSAKGWLSIASIEDDISVSILGINHIEHDLPKSGDSLA